MATPIQHYAPADAFDTPVDNPHSSVIRLQPVNCEGPPSHPDYYTQDDVRMRATTIFRQRGEVTILLAHPQNSIMNQVLSFQFAAGGLLGASYAILLLVHDESRSLQAIVDWFNFRPLLQRYLSETPSIIEDAVAILSDSHEVQFLIVFVPLFLLVGPELPPRLYLVVGILLGAAYPSFISSGVLHDVFNNSNLEQFVFRCVSEIPHMIDNALNTIHLGRQARDFLFLFLLLHFAFDAIHTLFLVKYRRYAC
ncbi:hypothetical protein GG344DRAFT_74927 [Lentinula edodes]|nr:hypothetical protein GG344DRAFT_74927 [Lentinula edodes]